MTVKDFPSSPIGVGGFDVSVLEDLVDGDRAMFEKFTQMFVSSFETALANVDSALANGDLVAMRAMGHRAKTTARNVGAIALGNACEMLEITSETSTIDAATQAAVDLRPMFEAVRTELSRRIDQPTHSI